MFNFLKKKTPPSTVNNLQSITLKLNNLDCPSCAVDLDLALEEIPGIISAKTNYAKSETKISFDPKKITLKEINKTLTNLGYQII